MNAHTKLVSRKQELNFVFLPAAKSFTEITSASKCKELAGKLTLFQQKLILTYNISNYVQNIIQNVFFFILFHRAPLSTSSHIQTFTCPSGTSVQSPYLQIHVCYSKIRLRGKLIISTLVLDLSTQNHFCLFLSPFHHPTEIVSHKFLRSLSSTVYVPNTSINHLLYNECANNILPINIFI